MSGPVDYESNRYSAKVLRWVDGDTVRLRVDLGQRVQREDNFRLIGIDAPETALRAGVTPEEKAAGRALTKKLTEEYPPGSMLVIATSKSGKYGRWLVTLWDPSDEKDALSINDKLVAEGLVKRA